MSMDNEIDWMSTNNGTDWIQARIRALASALPSASEVARNARDAYRLLPSASELAQNIRDAQRLIPTASEAARNLQANLQAATTFHCTILSEIENYADQIAFITKGSAPIVLNDILTQAREVGRTSPGESVSQAARRIARNMLASALRGERAEITEVETLRAEQVQLKNRLAEVDARLAEIEGHGNSPSLGGPRAE